MAYVGLTIEMRNHPSFHSSILKQSLLKWRKRLSKLMRARRNQPTGSGCAENWCINELAGYYCFASLEYYNKSANVYSIMGRYLSSEDFDSYCQETMFLQSLLFICAREVDRKKWPFLWYHTT